MLGFNRTKLNMKKNNNLKLSIISLLALFFIPCSIMGQDVKEIKDTLCSAVVIADSIISRPAGLIRIDPIDTRKMITALGEGDVIKYIQTLPGISTGVESSSSFYVRGGNIGNNVVTLDGVRIYGYGHLLGITSVFSNKTVGNVIFNVGGFEAESGNLLSSHIKVETKDGNFKKIEGEGSVSNFIVSGYASAPIVKDKLSFVASARVSPLSLEYTAGKSILEHYTNAFNDIEAGIYDLFGKITYKISPRNKVSGEIFYSMDKFGYGNQKGTSYDQMKWHNLIANIQWDFIINNNMVLKTKVSYNDYGSEQNQEKNLESVYNRLGVESNIKEITFGNTIKYIFDTGWNIKAGIRGNISKFHPGSSKVYDDEGSSVIDNNNDSDNLITTIFGELEYNNEHWGHLMLAARGNGFVSNRGKSNEYKTYNPELSISANKLITEWMGVETTFDYLSQYYHTLEGIPLGWSLDMIVPSSNTLKPEQSLQYYGGVYFKFKKNRSASIGGYYKTLKDVIYFSKATDFFGSQLSSWNSYIETGKGTSWGIELLYEKRGAKLNYKISYTYSKTDRKFDYVNLGRTFHAKYDRPHILNVTADYLFINKSHKEFGTNLLFTFQSGNMESVKSATFIGEMPGGKDVILDYYSGINNLRLKNYIRLDIGCYAKFKRTKVTHLVKVGIYNVMNRHNHFSLYYNNDENQWKQIYIFPLVPSLNYTIEF